MHRRLSRWFLFITNSRQLIATAGLIIHFDDWWRHLSFDGIFLPDRRSTFYRLYSFFFF
jgi:hypothetical protein